MYFFLISNKNKKMSRQDVSNEGHNLCFNEHKLKNIPNLSIIRYNLGVIIFYLGVLMYYLEEKQLHVYSVLSVLVSTIYT